MGSPRRVARGHGSRGPSRSLTSGEHVIAVTPKGSKAAPTHAAKAWRWGIDAATRPHARRARWPASSAYGRRCCLPGAGHAVTLHERSTEPFAEACSPYAGAMLAPRCEEESTEAVVGELGRRSIALWHETYPGTKTDGTLVVALHRDRAELDRFARMTGGHRRLRPPSLQKPNRL